MRSGLGRPPPSDLGLVLSFGVSRETRTCLGRECVHVEKVPVRGAVAVDADTARMGPRETSLLSPEVARLRSVSP
jgi:hypothetical protein